MGIEANDFISAIRIVSKIHAGADSNFQHSPVRKRGDPPPVLDQPAISHGEIYKMRDDMFLIKSHDSLTDGKAAISSNLSWRERIANGRHQFIQVIRLA